jgi:hypothetical protein
MKLYLLLLVLTFSGSLLLQAGDNEDSNVTASPTSADPAQKKLTSGEEEHQVGTHNELPADETVPEKTVVILEVRVGARVQEKSVCVCIIDEVLDYTERGYAGFQASLGEVRQQIDRLRRRHFFSMPSLNSETMDVLKKRLEKKNSPSSKWDCLSTVLGEKSHKGVFKNAETAWIEDKTVPYLLLQVKWLASEEPDLVLSLYIKPDRHLYVDAVWQWKEQQRHKRAKLIYFVREDRMYYNTGVHLKDVGLGEDQRAIILNNLIKSKHNDPCNSNSKKSLDNLVKVTIEVIRFHILGESVIDASFPDRIVKFNLLYTNDEFFLIDDAVLIDDEALKDDKALKEALIKHWDDASIDQVKDKVKKDQYRVAVLSYKAFKFKRLIDYAQGTIGKDGTPEQSDEEDGTPESNDEDGRKPGQKDGNPEQSDEKDGTPKSNDEDGGNPEQSDEDDGNSEKISNETLNLFWLNGIKFIISYINKQLWMDARKSSDHSFELPVIITEFLEAYEKALEDEAEAKMEDYWQSVTAMNCDLRAKSILESTFKSYAQNITSELQSQIISTLKSRLDQLKTGNLDDLEQYLKDSIESIDIVSILFMEQLPKDLFNGKDAKWKDVAETLIEDTLGMIQGIENPDPAAKLKLPPVIGISIIPLVSPTPPPCPRVQIIDEAEPNPMDEANSAIGHGRVSGAYGYSVQIGQTWHAEAGLTSEGEEDEEALLVGQLPRIAFLEDSR